MKILSALAALVIAATAHADTWQLDVDAELQHFGYTNIVTLDLVMQRPVGESTTAEVVRGTITGMSPDGCLTCLDSIVFEDGNGLFSVTEGVTPPIPGDFQFYI